MLSLLLKQNELDSIHILASTIYNLNCSVDYIREHILNGKTTIKQNVTILNDTFTYLGYSDLKLSISNGQVTLVNFNHETHSNLLLFVSEYFVLDSPTYKSTLVLLHEKFAHKEALLNQVHISESYLSKIMKEINDYISPAGVSIISRKKEYIFDGPVENWVYIDFFTRIFFSVLSSPFLTPTSSDEASFDAQLNDLSDDTVKHDYLIQALNSFPKPVESYISDTDALEVLQLITQIHDCSLIFTDDYSFIPTERELYNLYIRLSSSTIDSTSQRHDICNALLQEHRQGSRNLLIKDTVLLVDTIFEFTYTNHQPQPHEYLELMYSLLFKQLQYRVCKANISALFDLAPSFFPKSEPHDDKINETIELFYTTKMNSLPLTQTTFKTMMTFKESITSELYTIIASGTATPIKLFIKMDYNPSQDFFIKKIITDTFSTDIIEFTLDIGAADLIISDHHLNLNHKAPLFYLIDSNSDSTLQALFMFIFNIMVNKKHVNVLATLK